VPEIKIMSRDKGRWVGEWVGKCSKYIFYEFVALPTCGMKMKQMEKPFMMMNNCQFYCIETLQQRGNEMENLSTPTPSNL
jgi:hypothetical protein